MKNKYKIALPLLVLAAGVVLAAVIVKARPAVERQADAVPPPLVRAIEVTLQEVRLDVASQGTVRPSTESTLVAQVAGQVTRIAEGFADGGFFRKGQTLLWIDPRDYELRVSQAEAEVAQARVGLQREQAEVELARQEWRELGEGEPTALTLREPQLAESRARLQAAEASLEQARLNLTRTQVRAPFEGRVRERRVDVGQYVAAGTAVAAVFSTDYAEVKLPVSEDALGYLEVDLGRTVAAGTGPEVRLSGRLGGETLQWEGRIVRSDSQFDSRTRMLNLFARVKDPFGLDGDSSTPLPMGLFVSAEILGKSREGVAVVPREAIRERDRVLVVEDERLRFRDIEILRLEGDRALIRAGLESGEKVCVSALETAVDGMSVRVQLEEGLL
jgi:RND family efflux transporter MFP subunit